MDLNLYNQIKQLPQYLQLINMGYLDISTDKKTRLGSIELSNEEACLGYSITGKSGKIYQSAIKNTVIAELNRSLTTLQDYAEALSLIAKRAQKRRNDVEKVLAKDKKLSIIVLFGLNPSSIYKLSSYLKHYYPQSF